MIRGRKGSREIISWIDETLIPSQGTKVALEVVVQTLMDIGSKSFTHLVTVLERYGQVFAKLCPEHSMQIALIDEISSYWKNNTQMTTLAIDRMMGYRLISNLAIVNWVFSPTNIEQFHISDRPWEVDSLMPVFLYHVISLGQIFHGLKNLTTLLVVILAVYTLLIQYS